MNYKIRFDNIPARVRVATKVFFEILWQNELNDKNGKLHGITIFDPENKQIILNKQQSNKDAVYSLYHEYHHALNYQYGIGLTEKQILKLEACYHQTKELIFKLEGIKK